MNGRHRLVRRHRAVSACVSGGLVAGLVVGLPSLQGAATAADACLTPKVADVMVTQGLPNYKRLVQGKRALVKVFLQTPSCAPVGTAIRVTKADLAVSGTGFSGVLPPLATLPLSQIAPSTTSPVPTSEGDPVFGVPADVLKAPAGILSDVTVGFSATVDFSSTYKDSKGATVTQTGRLQVAQDEEGKAITALLGAASNPLRVLTVPMGDGGTLVAPKTADSQFGTNDKSALTRGLTAVSRVLPVADGVTALDATGGGLRTSMSTGLVKVGTVTATNRFCGTATNFTDIDRQLNLSRINWNSVNPNAPADRAYGVISQAISRGGVDGTGTGCADGYASINGTTAWGRVVEVEDPTVPAPRPTPAPVRAFTGALATMELLHTTGSVASGDSRNDGDAHSSNTQADVSAPDRAWNVPDQRWLSTDRSSMAYRQDGVWNDGNALLEKRDWDTLVCQLTPALAGGAECPTSTAVGRAGAILNPGTSFGSFFLAGETDGTPEGTDAHTYIDEDRNYEQPNGASEYRFVQVDAQGNFLANDGFTVVATYSQHHGPADESGDSTRGTFGTEFPAVEETSELRLYKGDPATDPSAVLLHSRPRDEAPQFFATSVQGRTVAVQALDATPENLRLDIFHVCPGGLTSPIVNAAKPQRVGGLSTNPVAVFTEVADTSLGCSNGFLRYRLSDGFLVSTRDELGTVAGAGVATAAIYAPLGTTPIASGKVIALAGDGRDALGRAATSYAWSIQGPSYPAVTEIASGSATTFYPPAQLQAGNYVLTLRTTAVDGSTATAQRGFAVCQDSDGDGLCDQAELLPCYTQLGYDAVTSQANAHIDSDFDGLDNSADPAPCVSLNNGTAQFTATSLNTGANGNTVMMKVTSTAVDLRRVVTSDVGIAQVSGHRLAEPLPAISWVAESATAAKVTFDRQQLSRFITSKGLVGPTPIFLVAPNVGLRAGDAQAPNSF